MDFQAREKLLLLWYHENLRVFSDRLVSDTDRRWFDDLLRSIMEDEFQCDPGTVIGSGALFYGDFCGTSKEYEEIIDKQQVSMFHPQITKREKIAKMNLEWSLKRRKLILIYIK